MSCPHRLVRSACLLVAYSCGCCGGFGLLNDIDQKVKDIRLLNGFSDIFFLQGSSFVQLTVIPRPDTQIQNKQFTRLGKQDGRFGTNHADIFVGFHDPLDASQRQIIVRLEIVLRLLFQTGNVLQGLMPKGIEGMIELRQKLRRRRRQLGQAIFAQQNGFATIRGGRCGRRRRRGQGRGHGPRGCGTDDQGCRVGDRQGSIGGHDSIRCSRSRSCSRRGAQWRGCRRRHGRVGGPRCQCRAGRCTRRAGRCRCGRRRCCGCRRWCIGFENAGLNLGLGMGMDQGLGLQLNLRLQLRRSIAALRGIFVAGMDNGLGLDLGQGGNLRRIHGLQSTPTTLGRCHDG